MGELMKKRVIAASLMLLSVSPASQAEQSWWESLKSMLGMGEAAPEQNQQQAINVNGIVAAVEQNLGVTRLQAEQGIAAILNFLKSTANSEQFNQLKANLPGIDQVLAQVPEVPEVNEGEAKSLVEGLLQKAAQYSESAQALSDLQRQFEAAGLKPEMLQGYLTAAEDYLNTPKGQAAKQSLSNMLDQLIPEQFRK